jgi:hypothetical protein
VKAFGVQTKLRARASLRRTTWRIGIGRTDYALTIRRRARTAHKHVGGFTSTISLRITSGQTTYRLMLWRKAATPSYNTTLNSLRRGGVEVRT